MAVADVLEAGMLLLVVTALFARACGQRCLTVHGCGICGA